MAYYYVQNFEESADVVRKLQECSIYYPVPQIVDREELKRKIAILSALHGMWTEKTSEDYSYQSEVYQNICEMFSKNVFHDLPPSSYSLEDTIDDEMMWEFKQLNPVYKAFAAFLDLNDFDEEKMAPYADKTFIGGLMCRLHSCVEAERDWVKRILCRLLEKASYSREHILRGTVTSLAGYKRSLLDGGVNELLELFGTFMCHKMVDSSTIFKVLCPLIGRSGLCHYAQRLCKCFETAAREVDADLAVGFVGHAIDHWPAVAVAATVPSLCRVLAALYFDACAPEWRRNRVRGCVAGHVVGRLVAAVETGRGDSVAVAACHAYAEFCGRLIDDEATAAAGGQAACHDQGGIAELLAEGLMTVYRTGRGFEYAGHLLRRLVAPDDRGRRLVGADCRLAIMEALLESRSRTVVESLVDTSF